MNHNIECSTTLAPQNTLGWHMRPAGLLVGIANMFESDIVVKCGRRIASAKSLLGILTLGAGREACLYVTARGNDAQKAIHTIKAKFSQGPDDGEQDGGPQSPFGGTGSEVGRSGKKEEQVKSSPVALRKSPTKKEVTTTFRCNVKPDAENVFLAGDFNGWDPEAAKMTRRGAQFSKAIKLLPGQYQYKFVIDGEWHADHTAPLVISESGSTNNIISV